MFGDTPLPWPTLPGLPISLGLWVDRLPQAPQVGVDPSGNARQLATQGLPWSTKR